MKAQNFNGGDVKMCGGDGGSDDDVRWPRPTLNVDDSAMVARCHPRRRHRCAEINVNSQRCNRDSLLKSSLYKLIVMWLVINVHVSVVVSEVEQLYAIPDDYQWTNGGADVAAAVAAEANNDIDNDQPMMIIYDEEFDVTDADYDGGKSTAAATASSTTMATAPSTLAGHFTSTWAVHIPGGDADAARVAAEHGFSNLGKVSR